ncbi:ras guanine nucleotide exchange factor domain-containing protein [Aspergillus aurantiobrunneus]
MSTQDKKKRLSADVDHIEFPERIIYDDTSVVKAGSVTALVENLTRPDKLDASFNRTFLTTYTCFTTGNELLQLLLARFDSPPPPALTRTQAAQWFDETQPVIQLRVVNVLNQWLDGFWAERGGAETHKNLLTLQLFASHITAGETSAGAVQQLLEIIRCRLQGVERVKASQPSVVLTPPKPILPRKLNKLQFLKVDAMEIARQLTLMEWAMFSKIPGKELLDKNWQKEESSNIRGLIRFFNQLSGWVAALVLAESDLKKRTQVIGHWVCVADACHGLQNYSALVSILSGLESAPVYRLGRTWAMVTERSCSILEPLQAIVSRDRNYQAYRDAIRLAIPPCIPFLGLFLKDLVFIADGNPSVTADGLVNFSKYSKTASTVHEIQRFQQTPYPLHPVPELQEYLSTQLQSARDVSEGWDRSCELEPRGRGDGSRSRDTYTATGGMTTSMVVACMILDN